MKIPNCLFYWDIGRFSKGLKDNFELAMLNELSVFELLRFDCNFIFKLYQNTKSKILHENSKNRKFKSRSSFLAADKTQIYDTLEKDQARVWQILIHRTDFNLKKRKFQCLFLFILFRLNVAFNNLSVISRRFLDVIWSSMLTLRVLHHWHITPQAHDVTFHPATIYWHRTDQFNLLNAGNRPADLNGFYHKWASAWQKQHKD